MKIRKPSEDYLNKVETLTIEERDRLLSRMRGKLMRRIEDNKLNTLEGLAIQLEVEDIELEEWRERMNEITANEKTKKKAEVYDQ